MLKYVFICKNMNFRGLIITIIEFMNFMSKFEIKDWNNDKSILIEYLNDSMKWNMIRWNKNRFWLIILK